MGGGNQHFGVFAPKFIDSAQLLKTVTRLDLDHVHAGHKDIFDDLSLFEQLIVHFQQPLEEYYRELALQLKTTDGLAVDVDTRQDDASGQDLGQIDRLADLPHRNFLFQKL